MNVIRQSDAWSSHVAVLAAMPGTDSVSLKTLPAKRRPQRIVGIILV